MCGLADMVRNTCDRTTRPCKGIMCLARPDFTPNPGTDTGTGGSTNCGSVGSVIQTYTYNGPGNCPGAPCGFAGVVNNTCPSHCRSGATPLTGVPLGASINLICTSDGPMSYYNGQPVG